MADGVTKAVKELGDSVGRITALGNEIRTAEIAVSSYNNAFADLSKSIKSVTNLGGVVSSAFGGISSSLTGTSSAMTDFFDLTQKSFNLLGNVAGGTLQAFESVANLFDGPSRQIRAFDNDIFKLNKRFGGTVGEASKFADALKTETGSQFSRSLYLTREELSKFAKATTHTQLTLEQLSETVETSFGQTNLLAASTAFAEATGMSYSSVASNLNEIINKQGVSVGQAAEMLGVYAGTAEATGLSVDFVARSLNSAVSGFSKLGVSADFGRPMLEGFSRVVKDMGLGLSEAGSLATSLSSSLAGLSTDYANAFIVTQRGGLETAAGGGALGASIGLQSEILSAEKTGDQAKLASDLAGAMKETLASFAGGEIITVSEAADSPELQSQFYVQQQLLQSQFGIRDQASANRTLEFLKQLDGATREGNTQAMESLEKQIQNEREGRDVLLDEFEKANRELQIQSNLLAVVAREPLMELKKLGGTFNKNWILPTIEAAGEESRNFVSKSGPGMQDHLSGLRAILGDEPSATNLQEFRDRMENDTFVPGASTNPIDASKLAAEVNRIQDLTPYETESFKDILEIIGEENSRNPGYASSFGADGLSGTDLKAAIIEALEKANADKNLNITISVDDNGKMEAYYKVVDALSNNTV
jgi:hypothetical protein